MKIDLHIHTKTGSDGNLPVEEVFQHAADKGVDFMSITDHDSIAAQSRAAVLAKEHGITCISGIEMNVTLQYGGSKSVSLDFLGYRYDINNKALRSKLHVIKEHRDD